MILVCTHLPYIKGPEECKDVYTGWKTDTPKTYHAIRRKSVKYINVNSGAVVFTVAL